MTNTNDCSLVKGPLNGQHQNAFKHVSEDSKENKWITIHIQTHGGKLAFTISNSADKGIQNSLLNDTMYKGLGLKNVKRRLDLVYPDAYVLQISKEKESFNVKLEIDLEEQVHKNTNKVAV